MANENNIRSAPSRNPSYLRFVNRTARAVVIKWFDYVGLTVNYGTLNPNDFNDIITFEGHPWKCEDAVTRTRLLLNKAEIFYPAPSFNGGTTSNPFEYVYITLPVLSLMDLSTEVVIKNVHDREDIMALKLPEYLKTNLESKYRYL